MITTCLTNPMTEQRIKVIEVEVSHPLNDIVGLDTYTRIKGLVRLYGKPLGYIEIPLLEGVLRAASLRAAILRHLEHQMATTFIRSLIDIDPLDATREPARSTLGSDSAPLAEPHLHVTVAVCTRDRATQLADCLESLLTLEYSHLELIVVDNASRDDQTQRLLRESFPGIRYVSETRPGLDWARNRAIAEATGDVIAFTDDDVIVDPLWVRSLARVFANDPEVMAVTGLVAPYELETHAQILFETYGGFGRGFRRRWYRIDSNNEESPFFHVGSGRFGTGANMAYRRSLFDRISGFDPALDVGTVTNGGGDLEMFFRVLQEGYTLVYEPEALVWHRHRRSFAELREQLRNHGIGLYSHLVRSARAYPAIRWPVYRFGLWWMWHWNLRRLLESLLFKTLIPRELIVEEFRGALIGLTRYQKARQNQKNIEREFSMPRREELNRVEKPAGLSRMESRIDDKQ